MQVILTDTILQTNIFIAIFIGILLLSIRKKDPQDISFGVKVSSELKGFAILAIVFSHIGYFLVKDTRFLFPLSICAGVSVDIFLFLSGYGVALQQIKNTLKPLQFYKKRLLKLFIPFWIVLAVFLILDKLILHIDYGSAFYIKSIFGLFTTAQIYNDFNSPLWYFTFILGYYLAFPLLFFPKKGGLSALALFLFSLFLISVGLNLDSGVLNLYATHVVAFPLGVLLASFVSDEKSSRFFDFVGQFVCAKPYRLFRYGLVLSALVGFFYLAIHSGVGGGVVKEQYFSIITMVLIWIFFVVKPFDLKLFKLFGDYSYEVYLLHWPIFLRYGFLYQKVPAALTTLIYLVVILLLGFLLKKLISRLSSK